MAPRAHRRGRRAFSFLEIVFAIAILACAMLPIIQGSRGGIRRAGFNLHRITATMLTNQLMERYRTMPYAWLLEQFGSGDVDMAQALKQDAVLGSPFLPESYAKMVEGFNVRGSFSDLCGDGALGLLSFAVEWKATPTAKPSTLSLGKVVINYKKFGITTVGPSGGLLQEGDLSVAALSHAGDAPPQGSSGSPAPGVVPPPALPSDIIQLINTFGSGGC